MNLVVRRGALRNASSSAYSHKGVLLDVTHCDPQAQVHLRNGSASSDGSAAQTSEARKRQYYARPGHVSFDERSYKLWTPWKGGLQVHQRSRNVCRKGEGGRKHGAERRHQGTSSVSVATQVAISRRVHRYKLPLMGTGNGREEDKEWRIGTNDLGLDFGCTVVLS